MQGIIEQALTMTRPPHKPSEPVVGTKIGIMGTLFGCWHKRLSRPFTEKNSSYRTCLECGARRKFNTESFKTSGPYYYPPSVRPDPFR
jgi:hypothetical protein